MAESVHIVVAAAQLAHISAVRHLDALGHGDDYGILLLQKLLGILKELVDIEHCLGQIDGIRSLALLCLGKGGGTCQPPCVTSHDLDDGDGLFLIVQTQGIADNLLGGSGDVLGGASEAGGVVGEGQVVVNGLGYAQELLLMSLQNRVVGQLLDGVHGIVSADVDECLNLQLVHDFEQLLINLRILMNLGQLIPAGAQESRRRPL